MAERPNCRLCESRKPKRSCPGISADICPQCCAREREETIHCPLDCVYLVEGRKHGKPPDDVPPDFPHKDIQVEQEFIEQSQELFTVMALSLIKAAQETPGAVDTDMRECLESVIKTYLTLDSGLIYESRAANTVAASMQKRLVASIEEFKVFAYEKTGIHSVKDGDVLKIFVFLQRLELTSNNGRRYGRAFLWSLRNAFEVQSPDTPPVIATEPSGLIL